MVNARGYAVSGCFMALAGIAEIVRHDVALAGLAFFLATACGLRAHSEWKRENG